MEEMQQSPGCPCAGTLASDPGPSASTPFSKKEDSPLFRGDSEMDVSIRDSVDSMILVSGPRLIRSGYKEIDSRGDDFMIFINAGGGAIEGHETQVKFSSDSFFDGGDKIQTNDSIVEAGDFTQLYQSARYGNNFCYKFDGFAPGDYFVDLHFAEIVNIIGPRGIRTFDIFMQDEKIASKLDIYAIVGGNKPLQLVDVRVSVCDNGLLVISFKGVSGNPIVCGIGVRKAPSLPPRSVKPEHMVCSKCSSEFDVSPPQNRVRGKLITNYEKRIQELMDECKSKSDECYAAWCSVESANEELRILKTEFNNKIFHTDSLGQTIETLRSQLRDTNERYQRDKKLWTTALADLEQKIKVMKEEQSKLSKEAHECADSIPDLSQMTGAVRALVAQCDDLKMKYSEEMARNKRLFNQVQESKGNIRVFCRCRPLSKEEFSSSCTSVVDFDGARDGEITVPTSGTNTSKKIFKFDRVFTPKDGQEDVYADASPLVTSVLDGYNVCIFAYGQTGTGKTFTMEGTERNRGVNYRTLEELFRIAGERRDTVIYSISVSVLEVYNEQIRDLLAPSPSSKKLEVRQGEGVSGIVEAKVESIKQVWDVLQAGSKARAVGSNNVNEHSSRSHCVLCVMVSAKNLMNGERTKSKLWLVDLAGSERLAKTEAQGERLKEAQNINKSLSALGDVISALANKSSHIPYRNSKLTHILQDSLGGDSKALMFVNISPSDNDLGETLSSLNFASRVRGVDLGPAKRQVDTSELQKLKQMLEKAKHEGRTKDENFRKLEENYQSLENKYKGICKNLQEKNKEIEGQKMETQNVLDKQQRQLVDKLKEKDEACLALQQKVRDLECKTRQSHQESAEISALQQKVKELEMKLKECNHDQSVAEFKAKELEYKLMEIRQSDAKHENKIRELERIIQEKHNKMPQMDPIYTIKDETMWETESNHILRSSNSINKPPAVPIKEPIFLLGESLPEMKRKREMRNSATPGEIENIATSNFESLVRKKSLPSELNNNGSSSSKVRRIDPTKTLGRLTRSTKMAVGQKSLPRGTIGKDQLAGGVNKERDRRWVR